MKRIFTIFLVALSIQMFAQNLVEPRGNKMSAFEMKSYEQSRSYFIQHALNKTNSTDGGWYNYRDALINSTLGSLVTYYFNIYNDSTVQTLYKDATTLQTKTNYVFLHHVGIIIDPRGDCYDTDPFQSNQYTRYTMDSVSVPYSYRRHNPDPNVVDTIVIQFYQSSAVTKGTLNGNNNAVFATTLYTAATNMGTSSIKTVKIPLTIADTAVGLNFAEAGIDPPINIPAGGQAMASYKFVSGQTTNFGDTMNADYDTAVYKIKNRLNEVRVYIARDNNGYDQSTAADPTYNRVYNNGLVAFSESRYDFNTNGWSPRFIPANAYIGFHYVPDMYVKVTSTNVGINNAAKEFLKDVQVYPNPTNGANTVAVEYKLTKSANVSIEIVNILGKKLSSVEIGKKDAGTQTQSINISDLSDGIYFANIYVNGVSQTVKFTVTK